jgi:hypothetical protein
MWYSLKRWCLAHEYQWQDKENGGATQGDFEVVMEI